MSGETYNLCSYHRIKRPKTKRKTKYRPNGIPMHYMLSLYPLHHDGMCKDYSYSPEIISFSMLADNDEYICVYYGEGRTLVLLHYYPCSRM